MKQKNGNAKKDVSLEISFWVFKLKCINPSWKTIAIIVIVLAFFYMFF